jgi:hypothetical protein
MSSMSRKIEIHLSEAQADALAQEASAKGVKFFDHCRNKQLAGTTTLPMDAGRQQPLTARELAVDATRWTGKSVAVEQPRNEADRLDRLEDAVGQILQALRANVVGHGGEGPAEYDQVDMDDVVNRSLAEADRQSLTIIEREPLRANAGGVRHVGTRQPTPMTVATTPSHLRGL